MLHHIGADRLDLEKERSAVDAQHAQRVRELEESAAEAASSAATANAKLTAATAAHAAAKTAGRRDGSASAEATAKDAATRFTADHHAKLQALLRMRSITGRLPLHVTRGLQAFAENAQVHGGGGSFYALRLTLFIARHLDTVAAAPYGQDDQVHACHILYECWLLPQALQAAFYNRHLSPDAPAHLLDDDVRKVFSAFLAEVKAGELEAAAAGREYTLPADVLLKHSQALFAKAWTPDIELPPWVPDNLLTQAARAVRVAKQATHGGAAAGASAAGASSAAAPPS